MPFTAQELETWVNGLGISEDKKKSVLEAMGSESVLAKVGETVLMRGDYSKRMDELATEKQRLEADYKKKVADEDAFRTSLSGWKTDAEKKFQSDLQASTDAAEARLNAARGKIKELATRNGIPEDEIKDLIPASATVTRTDPPPRDPDTGKFLSRDEYNREASAYVKLPAIMVGLDREYYRLFGNDAPPVNWEKVIEGATANKRTVTAEFEATFKMSDKRSEIADTAHKKEIADAEKRGAESALSKAYAEHPELSQRSVSREVHGSVILDEARKQSKDGPPKLVTGGPRSTVESAVAAFQSGKYKGGVEHPA